LENGERKTAKIAVAILTILLLTSMAMLLNSNMATAQDYGDIMQYDWPQGGYDEGLSGFNPGPGPNRPNVLWKVQTGARGMVSVFNGKAFAVTGSMIGFSGRTLSAFDAFTGQRLWVAEDIISISGVSGVQKLDDNYLLGENDRQMTCIRISDGTVMWEIDMPTGTGMPGSGSYFDGHYSTSMKKHIHQTWEPDLYEGQIHCYDLSDPANEPPLAWTYVSTSPAEILCSGDGRFYLGSTEATVIAIDGETGEFLWETSTNGGLVQQSAFYYNGKLYTSAVSTQMTCFDGETGEIVWQYEKGPRAFSAYRGCAGDGMVFDTTMELEPHGAVRAWDAETGELLWAQPAYFNIAYTTMAYADGKVYTSVCDRSTGIQTGGTPFPGYGTGCYDAYTGTLLWRLDGINMATPSIAYGNLYGLASGYLWCIGGDPKDWTHGFHGNVDQHGVGQSGPADISTPKWAYQTGGDVLSSPAVVDGKVYVGSHDKNWYCLDAYTGEKIWNYTIDFYVRSSCAVVNGRVFTGADDGNFYCLDADTGELIWSRATSAHYPGLMVPTEFEPRSSPIVMGGRMYVGALDGKVYCLDTADGSIEWTHDFGTPVIGSPAYSDGKIYITATDWYLYALNANDGSLEWQSDFTINLHVVPPDRSSMGNIGTPTVAEGLVVVGGGCQYGTAEPDYDYVANGHSEPSGAWGGTIRMAAFDAETGDSVWNISRAGNTQPGYVPCYFDGQIYAGEFFYITSMDLQDPNSGPAELGDFGGSRGARLAGPRTWAQWVGYQVASSVAYADDPTGAKVYVGCDIGSIYCIDAETGQSLSVFTTKGNVPSSPAIWDGKMYCGSTDGNVYCFDDSPVVDMNLWAESNKGAQMYNTETLEICGALQANPIEYIWDPNEEDDYETGTWVAQPNAYHPGIPNVEIELYLTKPDGSDVSLTTTTDEDGYFEFSYSPTDIGEWGWVVNFAGGVHPGLTYAPAYGEWNPFNVNSPTAGPSNGNGNGNGNGTEPPPAGLPMEYVYAAIAVIIIVVVAFLAYIFLRKK
jgi:outer membrane protein assembly factor BamB